MTTKEIMNEPYLRNRAIQVVKDSLKESREDEIQDFAAFFLKDFESNGAPIEILDELYLAAYDNRNQI